MSIVTKADVPDFCPELLGGPLPVGPELQDTIVSGLVRGEQEAAQVGKFRELQRRNRELHLGGISREIIKEREKLEKTKAKGSSGKLCCFA